MSRRRRHNRGFTLLEVMVAGTLMLVLVFGAGAVFLAGGRLSRNSQQITDGQDSSQLAAELVGETVRNAGFGMREGLWVNYATARVRVNPIFGRDGTTGAGSGTAAPQPEPAGRDDLWLVLPSRNVYRDSSAANPGASSVVTGPAGATLPVQSAESFKVNDLVLVSDLMGTATLVTLTQKHTGPTALGFAESAITNFASAVKPGDSAYSVQLVHFYIADSTDGSKRPCLFRATGALQLDDLERPFKDANVRQEYCDVEDLQIRYGFDAAQTGNPADYVYQDGLAHGWVAGLRSVRVSVVSRTPKVMRDDSNKVITAYRSLSVENHLNPSGGAYPEGHRRSLYTLRVDLANLRPENL